MAHRELNEIFCKNTFRGKAVTNKIYFLIMWMVIFGLMSVMLGQDINWDLQNYHFYNAYAYLHHRMGFDIAPAMMQTYFNPYLDLFNYYFITTQKPIITAFVLGTISGISAFFLYETALMVFNKHYLALCAVIIGMSGYAGIVQLGSTTNETKTACLLMISLYCMLKYKLNDHKFLPVLSGLFCGFAVGFKLTSAVYGIGLIAALFFSEPISTNNFKTILIVCIFMGLGFLITNGYWMWFLYHHFQNPFFPFYNNIFHSSFAQWNNYEDKYFHPKSLTDYLLLPFYYMTQNTRSTEFIMRDFRFAICIIMLLITLLFQFKAIIKRNPIKFIVLMFVVSYSVWLIKFSIYRYTIILEMLSGIIIIYCADQLLPFLLSSNVTRKITLGALVLVILSTTLYKSWGRINYGQNYFDIMPYPIPIKDSQHSLLMLIDGYPLAYMLPFFPKEMRAVGVGNNFMHPNNTHQLQIQENLLILGYKKQQYPIYTLSIFDKIHNKPNFYNLNNQILHYYGFQSVSNCSVIKSNITNVLLCKVS